MQPMPKFNLGSQSHNLDRSSLQTTYLWTRQYSGGNVLASNAVFLEDVPHEQTVFERLLHTVAHKINHRSGNTDELKARQWAEDERAVRNGTCSFQVQYLGSVEVPQSKGVQIVENAIKYMKQDDKTHPLRKNDGVPSEQHWSTLHITSQLITVINDDTQNLIVENTIRSISFCCSHRRYDKVFAYISRQTSEHHGTERRRWICHAFSAITASGERLNHAVGCAFQACHEHRLAADNNNVREDDELTRGQSATDERDVEQGRQTKTTAVTHVTMQQETSKARPRQSSSASQGSNAKFEKLETVELDNV